VTQKVARRALAAVWAVVLVGVGVGVASHADAAAATPVEVAVVAADTATNFQNDQVWVAGATGFLHRYTNGSALLWTRYADGATTVLSDLTGVNPSTLVYAGGDTVTTTAQVPGHSAPDALTVLDLAQRSWRQLPKPTTGTYLAFYGSTMIVRAPAGTTGNPLSLRRYAADGSYQTAEVAGAPTGTAAIYAMAGDTESAVLRFDGSGFSRFGLLDLGSATVTRLPDELTSIRKVLLSSDRIGFFRYGTPNTVRVYSRADAAAGTAQTIQLPTDVLLDRVALVGQHVIAAGGDPNTHVPALDYSAPGTPTVLPMVQPSGFTFAQATDGALVVGGTGAGDWSVRHLTSTADEPIAQATALPLTGPLTNAGLSLAKGLLRHVEALKLPGDQPVRYQMFNHRLAAGTDGFNLALDGGVLADPAPSESGAVCVRTVDTNGYGLSYVTTGKNGSITLKQQFAANGSQNSTVLPSASGTVVDASLEYVIVNGSDPAKQYIVKPGYSEFQSVPVSAAALWFNTMWSSTTAGFIQAKNLVTGTAASPVATGASCLASELQATGRYIYWSCGADGPAGVYDATRRVNLAMPAGQLLLGDGYVVRHDASTGSLVRYDFSSGVLGDPVTVATFPHGPLAEDRGIDWTVDKYSGDIAYVDAADAVHVIDPAVPPSPPATGLLDTNSSDGMLDFGPYGGWIANFYLTRPVDSWSFTVTQVTTGKVVATKTGGPSREQIDTGWDGYLASKAKASSGHYRYTLTVTAAGTAGTTTIGSGTLLVYCGTPNFRSYECTGAPSILGVFKSGSAHWLVVESGTIRDNGYTEDWYLGTGSSFTTSAIVPFGDLNGDGFNDLIVRDGSGQLRGYYGIGQSDFSSQTRKSVVLGNGWNTYPLLLTTGDLTGDGIADVLARDKSNKLWIFKGTGKSSLATKIAVAGTYGETRLIGPGDINGDGKADMLMINSKGELWSVYGSGKATFGGAHKVSTGWGSFTAVLGAGDLNEDGRNDIAGRDSAGNFWLYPGDGKGGFGTRVKLATGYQKYAAMF
jgi:hypothetical protein